MANISSTITYNANLSPAQAQIRALTGQIAGLTAAFNSLDKTALQTQRSLASAFTANVGQIGGFTAQTIQAHNAVENFGKQLAANRLTMREYFREAFAGYTKQNSLMKQLAAQQVRYQQSVAVPMGGGQMMMLTPTSLASTGTSAAMAAQKFAVFNKLIDAGATSMLNWGKNTQWAGRQLMVGFTVPLAMFTAVASKQFRDLDKELTRFQKVYGSDLGGSMSKATEQMRKQVEQLAYDISRTYGIAAKDTAALAADIAATGAEGEKLISSVQQTTRLAVLGEVDRQEAMKATLALQSAFKMNTNELAESINFLNAVENQTSATLEDLATAIPKVGPVIRSLGGDVKDLSVLLVAMREGGIPAAEAANALKSGLASLINPTKQASEVAKQFGVDLVGIVEANRGQLMPTIYAMQDALSGLDSFSRSKIIEQIFGKYQFARITALFDNIGRVGSQTQSVLELAGKSSAELAKIANGEIRTLTESTAVKFQRTLEELKNAIIPIGQTLTETLIPIFEFIGKGIKTFTTFFQALPEPVKNFAKYGVAIAALAGPVIMLVGLFGNLIANGIKFGLMMTRLGARIAGIKVQPFELLNAEVMAAKLGIDNLTSSFTTQEAAMKKLVATMSQYEASLRRMTAANPALFIPGAVPPAGGRMPIRRQTGSSSPERVPGGYGGGDKIPALLEPGEMVVRKEAASQYASIILAMNRGNIQKLSDGTKRGASLQGGQSFLYGPYGVFARGNTPGARFGMSEEMFFNGNDFIDRLSRSLATAGVVERSFATQQPIPTRGSGRVAIDQEITTLTAELRPIAESIVQSFRSTAISMDSVEAGSANIQRIIEALWPELSQIDFSGVNLQQDYLENALRQLVMLTEEDIQKGGWARTYGLRELGSGGKLGSVSRLRQGGPELREFITGVDPSSVMGKETRHSTFSRLMKDYRGGPEYTLAHLSERTALGPQLPFMGAARRNPVLESAMIQQIIEKARRDGFEVGRDASGKLVFSVMDGLKDGVKKGFESNSPARRAQREFSQEGKNVADGVMLGLKNGFKSAVAGKTIIAGPVGGTGIESISNAQKIAQADQTILKLKETQLKYTADRVRAEVELLALQKAYARGEINIVQYKEQERKIAADLKLAKEKELRIQNIIDQQKQKIADADAAQLRAEQEEAKNAQRRAAASVGIGPGGRASWLMGGVSPYAKDKTPDWLRTRMDEAQKAARKGVPTGPSASLATVRATSESNGMRGMGAMNAMFAISMLTSSLTMVSGASEDAAAKIGMFTTALMTATMLMNTGISGKGVATNFLGLGSLGKKAMVTGRAMNIAAAAGGGVSRGGMALMGLGRGLSILGGPVGIAAGIGITAAITGFMMYRDAADKARERAIAAFNDPVKSAEYFGETIKNVSDIIENNRLSNISKDLEGIDSALREAVKQDYGPLIEQISSLSAGSGAQQLSMAYSNMIISGMSAENAKATIEAIATEAGMAGGAAFTEALSLGLLDQELTIKQAIDNIIGQFKPGETQLGNTGLTIAQSITKEITDTENAIAKLAPSMNSFQQWTLGLLPESWSSPELKNLIDQLDALRDRLQDLMSVNPELLSGVFDSLTIAYQQDPEAAISGLKDLTDIISGLAEGDQDAAMRQATDYLKNVYGESWNSINKSIDTQEELVVALQMAISGVSLDKATNSAGEFDAALGKATVSAKTLADATKLLRITAEEEYFTMINDFAQQQRDKINLDFENYSNAMDERIGLYEGLKEAAQESFDAEQKARQDSIDGMQDEMDQRRRAFDEEMDRLDDKENAIKKSSDAYIKSLEKNQKAESFYSQQRKTAFGALQKLASGDVFGFLQEREQMSQDAQQFSYDEMINKIEEKRDLELEVIDEVRKKKQDEQKEYEQMMEDRIQSVQDLMEIEQEAHDDRMKFYDDQIKRANTARQNALDDKNQEINGIKDMETDYRENSTKAEETYSKKYAELKAKPYVEARKEMLRLRIEEIYYRGGVSLARAVEQAGALAFPFRGRSAVTGVQNVLNELGLRGDPSWMYRPDNVGDTGVGDTQAVRDMTVTADTVTINGSTSGGSTTSSTPPSNPTQGQTWYNPETQQTETWNGTRWTAATGGYVKPFKNGGGGNVSGPGGPKSDVIPALLSNGEYVVQASSVGKYGKSMMDAINAGKYATGGYISADRAETAAQGNVYGGKPKPTYFGGTPTSSRGYNKPGPSYSGGTPTYSGGYTSTNKQAHSKYKKPQIGGGNFGRPGIDYPSFNAPSFKQEVGSLWDSLRVGLATVADSFAAPFLHPFGIRGSSDQTTALGRFIGGNSYGNASIIDKLSAAMSIIPIGGVGKSSAFDANAAAAKYFPNTVGKKPTVEGLYNPTVNDSLILKEDPFSLLYPVKARDTYLDEIFSQIKGGQGGVSPGGFVIGRDGIERYIKSPASDIPQAAYAEVFTTKLYDALGFKVPETSLLRLGAESRAYKIPTPIRYRSDPFAEDISTFKPGSLVVSSKKLQYDTSGGSYGPEILARELGFGTAMDQWMHFTDMHPGNYLPAHGTAYRMDFGSNPFYNASGEPISPAIYTNQSWLPLRKEPQGYPSISPAEISDQWRVLSNAVENRGGLKKLIQLVSDDILGTTGIELGNKSSVISFLENRLREGLKLTENPDNMHISTLPRKSFSHLANGGMVRKFGSGDYVSADRAEATSIYGNRDRNRDKVYYTMGTPTSEYGYTSGGKKFKKYITKNPSSIKDSYIFNQWRDLTRSQKQMASINKSAASSLLIPIQQRDNLTQLVDTRFKNIFGSPGMPQLLTSINSPTDIESAKFANSFLSTMYSPDLIFNSLGSYGNNLTDAQKQEILNKIYSTPINYLTKEETDKAFKQYGQEMGGWNANGQIYIPYNTWSNPDTPMSEQMSILTHEFGHNVNNVLRQYAPRLYPEGKGSMGYEEASATLWGPVIDDKLKNQIRMAFPERTDNPYIYSEINDKWTENDVRKGISQILLSSMTQSHGVGLQSTSKESVSRMLTSWNQQILDNNNTNIKNIPEKVLNNPYYLAYYLSSVSDKLKMGMQPEFKNFLPGYLNASKMTNGGIVGKFAEGGLVGDTKRGEGSRSYGKIPARIVQRAELPKPGQTTPVDGTTNGGATGTPLFDLGVLGSLGISMDLAKSVLGYLDGGGWPRDLHRLAWTIAMRESGGDPKEYKDNSNAPGYYSPGNGDYGLFQVNKLGYGNQPWFDIQKLLDGNYNSSVAYKYISQNGTTFLPWAMLKTYNGTSAGFNWGPAYGGRPSWGLETEKNTNDLWPAFLGYRGGTQPSSNGSDGSLALAFAKQQLGEPYVPDSDGPDSWDCSGLTAAAYNQGVPDGYKKYGLESYSTSQADRLRIVSRRASGTPGDGGMPNIPNNFNVGDLLYFTNTGLPSSGKHISMYAGSGQIIEAGDPVQINSLNNDWNRRFFTFGGPPIPKFAGGGFIKGPGGPRSDIIPAMLSNGEYVVKASAVNKYGKGFMDRLNSGQLNTMPRYASGGMVSPSYNIPMNRNISSSQLINSINSVSNQGDTSINNASNVKIVINGAGSNPKAIANKVIQMINSANNRRDHSRSLV